MMNRIILIGNGFDLAHGLPTSYADFIRGYNITLKLGLLEGEYERYDGLCSVNISDPEGNCWMRNSCKETGGRTRCGSFYAAVGMFRIRAAILQEHFARGYSDVVPHAAALKGCSFPNNQTPRYGFQTVPGCLSCSLRKLNIHLR